MIESIDKLVPEGHVISQEPEAGTSQLEGTTITLCISIGTPKITLFFDANGGSVNEYEQKRELFAGDNYGILPVPRNGNAELPGYYGFIGWFTEREGGTMVGRNSIAGIEDVTLYAHWQDEPVPGQPGIGMHLYWGHYGGEIMEWIVLAIDGTQALLLNAYGIDAKPYNDTRYYSDRLTWETCSLRTWLNGDFYENAFSEEEKERIQSVVVDENTGVNDKIFLLSAKEVNDFFYPSSGLVGVCYPTQYAKDKGVRLSDEGYCGWWLRSLSYYGRSALRVGYVTADPYYYDAASGYNSNIPVCLLESGGAAYQNLAVRPAFWINYLNMQYKSHWD